MKKLALLIALAVTGCASTKITPITKDSALANQEPEYIVTQCYMNGNTNSTTGIGTNAQNSVDMFGNPVNGGVGGMGADSQNAATVGYDPLQQTTPPPSTGMSTNDMLQFGLGTAQTLGGLYFANENLNVAQDTLALSQAKYDTYLAEQQSLDDAYESRG